MFAHGTIIPINVEASAFAYLLASQVAVTLVASTCLKTGFPVLQSLLKSHLIAKTGFLCVAEPGEKPFRCHP